MNRCCSTRVGGCGRSRAEPIRSLPLFWLRPRRLHLLREPALREATSLPKLSFPPSPGIFDRSQRLSGKAILCPPDLRGSACGTSPTSRVGRCQSFHLGPDPLESEQLADVGTIARKDARPE